METARSGLNLSRYLPRRIAIKSKKRIGILGGTFNPIHLGHLAAAQQVMEKCSMDRIIFVPACLPALKSSRDLVEPKHRLKMISLAIKGNPRFSVSPLEVNRGGTSYSIDTVMVFLREFGNEVSLFFIIGADALPLLPQWHRVQDLMRVCRFIVVSRPGCDVLVERSNQSRKHGKKTQNRRLLFIRVKALDISSTEIREKVEKRESISYLVPEAVERYIKRTGIYRLKRNS